MEFLAVLQLAGTVIKYLTNYIETCYRRHRDLLVIRIETLSLKSSLESLWYLHLAKDLAADHDEAVRALLKGCRQTLEGLQRILATDDSARGRWNTLLWPPRQREAHALLDNVLRLKTSISLLLLNASRLVSFLRGIEYEEAPSY